MNKRVDDDRTSVDLTGWRAGGAQFEDLLDQKFANLTPGLHAKHGRGILVVQLAEDNSWARPQSYLSADDLDDGSEMQHAALELIRLYDPKTQAVLGYSDEAGDWILDAKVVAIRNRPPAAAGAAKARPRPATPTAAPVGAATTKTMAAARTAPARPAMRGVVAVKKPVARPAPATQPMIECARAEYCRHRVERTKADAKWLAVVPGGTSAIDGRAGAEVASRALWFCSWACLKEFALAVAEQRAAAQL